MVFTKNNCPQGAKFLLSLMISVLIVFNDILAILVEFYEVENLKIVYLLNNYIPNEHVLAVLPIFYINSIERIDVFNDVLYVRLGSY